MMEHGYRTATRYPKTFKVAAIAFAIFFGIGVILELADGEVFLAFGVAVGGAIITATLLGMALATLFAVGAVAWLISKR